MMLRTNGGQSGRAVPLGSIASAEQMADERWAVTTAQGETLMFTNTDWKIALETPISVLPAHSGTYLVTANEDDEEPIYWRTNVLGWAICADGLLRPLTTDPVGSQNWTVLHPDGRVETSVGDTFDAVAAWLETTRIRR